jgi:peptidylprolyl isomerase
MITAKLGDRVKIHYVKRLQDGSHISSRSQGDAPLEITVGVEHPRFRRLGLDLVGLAAGERIRLSVPKNQAYGPHDPSRIRRLPITRFSKLEDLPIGRWVKITDKNGRLRSVRLLELRNDVVVVDTNHRGAGQALELTVTMVSIENSDSGPDVLVS